MFACHKQCIERIFQGSPDKSKGGAAKTCPLTDKHRFPIIFLTHIKHKPR